MLELEDLASRAVGTQVLTGYAQAVATMRNYQISSRRSAALAEPKLMKRLVLVHLCATELELCSDSYPGIRRPWHHVPACVWASWPSETNRGGEAASRLLKPAPKALTLIERYGTSYAAQRLS